MPFSPKAGAALATLAALGLAAVHPQAAAAQTSVFTFNNAGQRSTTTTAPAPNYTLGYSFTTGGAQTTLAALGYYAPAALQESHEVGLFALNGTQLADATVGAGQTGTGGDPNAYAPTLTLLNGFNGILTDGTTYLIGGFTGTNADPFLDYASSVTATNGFTYTGARLSGGSPGDTFSAPTNYINTNGYGAPNLKVTADTSVQIPVVNHSFEDADPTGNYGYTSAITGWTSAGLTGLNTGGPFTNNGTIPAGSQVAFLQAYNNTSASLTQTLSGFKVGDQYVVTFYDNAREYGNSDPHVTASLGGMTVVAPTAVSPVGGNNEYNFVTSLPFTATGTTADLVISNLATPGDGGDTTLLLDDVRVTDITAAPEPSQTAALGLGVLGLAGLAFAARRHKSAAL